MPEGHTIHRLAADLWSSLGRRPVRATSPQGRFGLGAAAIDGEPLLRSDAYGKYLFCEFGGGSVLHVHLGLIGKFRPVRVDATPTGSVRLRLENDDAAWQLTGPARCDVIDPEEEATIASMLGVDPLRPRPDVTGLRHDLSRTTRPIGATLLDQRIIAGIGNVYRAEILFLCGIHPLRPSSSLTDDEVTAIWEQTVFQLKRGKRLGRIVTTDPAEIGRPLSRIGADDRLYVYHREHCRRCGTELSTVKVGGRPMQFCPRCQPA